MPTPMLSSHARTPARLLLGGFAGAVLAVTALVAGPPETAIRSGDPTRVLGPQSCAECHVEEFETWEASAHQEESKMLTRNKEAQAIARALGIRRLKTDERCTTCHFTLQHQDSGSLKAVAGVSCESCHGGARDWLDLHDDYGGAGATAATESPDHRELREERCDAGGMVRPAELHRISEACFACHLVTDPELIAAGHPTGDGFELVSWSQGEIRHNFVRGEGTNALAPPAHRRTLYVIGRMLALKYALLALGEAPAPDAATPEWIEWIEYAGNLVARAEDARAEVEAIAAAADVMAVDIVLDALEGAELAPGMRVDELVLVIEECAAKFEGGAEELDLSGLEPLVPSEESFVGTPARL